MAYVWQRWLADEFRAAGLDVIEVKGWENRGRPASTGAFDPYGLNVHHNGVTQWESKPARGLDALIGGRPDLPGPIAHYATDYLGRIWVIAAGRANVNGRNRGVPNFSGRDGNRDLLGNEVLTDGTQPLPKVQQDAIALSSAVVLNHFGKDPDGFLYRHADTSTTGKWDIGQMTTAQVRAETRVALARLTAPPHAPSFLEEIMADPQAEQKFIDKLLRKWREDPLRPNGNMTKQVLSDIEVRTDMTVRRLDTVVAQNSALLSALREAHAAGLDVAAIEAAAERGAASALATLAQDERTAG